MKERFKVSKIDFGFRRRAGYLWLLGLLLTVVPAFASHAAIDSDLTFCPLQKAWVKKGGVSVKPPDPLKDVCASDAAKREFSYESYKRFGAAFDRSRAEGLFFDYSKVGKRAFDAARSGPVPGQSLSGGGHPERSAANAPAVPDQKAAASVKVELPLSPVIPAAQKAPGRPDISESKNLRRKSRPRAPPESL